MCMKQPPNNHFILLSNVTYARKNLPLFFAALLHVLITGFRSCSTLLSSSSVSYDTFIFTDIFTLPFHIATSQRFRFSSNLPPGSGVGAPFPGRQESCYCTDNAVKSIFAALSACSSYSACFSLVIVSPLS